MNYFNISLDSTIFYLNPSYIVIGRITSIHSTCFENDDTSSKPFQIRNKLNRPQSF